MKPYKIVKRRWTGQRFEIIEDCGLGFVSLSDAKKQAGKMRKALSKEAQMDHDFVVFDTIRKVEISPEV